MDQTDEYGATDAASSSRYEIDAKCFHNTPMAGPSKVRLLRLTPNDGVHDESALIDANLQRLFDKLHQIDFFESFLITSQDVLRDIRQTLGVGKSLRDGRDRKTTAASLDPSQRYQPSSAMCKKEIAKNVFLVTTECRFRCNIYLVNPRPLDQADETAFEVKTKSKSTLRSMKTSTAGVHQTRLRHSLYHCHLMTFYSEQQPFLSFENNK